MKFWPEFFRELPAFFITPTKLRAEARRWRGADEDIGQATLAS